MTFDEWETQFESFINHSVEGDSGHDLLHVKRVVKTAKRLAIQANAELAIVLPAAWLHDCVVIGKETPMRRQASRLSAQRAQAQLNNWGYPQQYIDAISHAIAAHSFSGEIAPQTLEAQIVQDADRLDALGAIGIARCFSVGASMGRPIYLDDDPFCKQRRPNDEQATLDHFYTKLLDLHDTMASDVGREEALVRIKFMRQFLAQFETELEFNSSVSLLLTKEMFS